MEETRIIDKMLKEKLDGKHWEIHKSVTVFSAVIGSEQNTLKSMMICMFSSSIVHSRTLVTK
jgi:acetyl-CoA carboxylase alpha subunit